MKSAKKKLVVLSGAGISAESGLKTFRDKDGLWEGYDLNEVATASAWRRDKEKVLDFYNLRRKQILEAEPNSAHHILAKLQSYFEINIITQNIDDLHERAGSLSVLHLHGEIFKMRSDKSNGFNSPIFDDIKIGMHAPDGGQFRPDIVWFEEPVPLIQDAIHLVKQSDILVVIGTSLLVYPAAGLIEYLPAGMPAFIVDQKIPSSINGFGFQTIEAIATEGMKVLEEILLKEYY
jgi:NAD-dependent deacetylase